MKPILYLLKPLLLIILLCGISSCSDNRGHKVLDKAESLMESHPDSAFHILGKVDKTLFGSRAEQARYALLMSMALDKNYIDTTTFDVLQPAIDYYIERGNANEKLRTYYYQGRIFQNQGDLDNALNSFVKGIDISPDSNDSLTIARVFVAQGNIYNALYDFDSYAESYLHAAEIYKKASMKEHEFDCLLNALNGSIILGNKTRGDSLLYLCNEFKNLDDEQKRTLAGYKLSHIIEFGTLQEINDFIDSQWDYTNVDTNGLLNLALAYNRIGNYGKSKQFLDYISGHEYDTLKYQAISVSTFEGMGEYKKALENYKDFNHKLDSINALKFDQKAQSLNEKHRIELKAQEDAQLKSRIIWICIGGIIILTLGVVILFLFVRSNRIKKDLALQKAKTAEIENNRLKSEKILEHQKAKAARLENDKLKSEIEKSALEKINLKLERDKKVLEAENLAHRVDILVNLKNLLDTPEEVLSELKKAMQTRMEMLNSLLASYISDNDQYEKPYDMWVKELTSNKEEFMNSNRLAFQVSHPRFIQYFEELGLTVDEINYVCLYAIGLRGKEVGNYMKKRSHVNTSSAIRKKLGIDKHETNIGIYVRKLLKDL